MERTTSFIKHRLPTLFALALLLTPGLAAAAEPGDPWQVALGAGLSTRPQYPGSDDTRLQPLPIFDISYRNRWFLRSSDGLGAYLVRGENCWISASVTPDLTRRIRCSDNRPVIPVAAEVLHLPVRGESLHVVREDGS